MRVTTGGGNLSIEGLGILGMSSLMLPQGKIASEVFYLDYVHPTLCRTQVSDGSNASLIMELLLMTVISCSDGRWILSGLSRSQADVSIKADIAIEIIQAMPNNCDPSDYRAHESERP